MGVFLKRNYKNVAKGRSHFKKTVKKGDIVHTGGGGGSTPVPFLSPNLPDSQITQKWTFDTTIWPNMDQIWTKYGLLTPQYGQIWPNMDQIWTIDTTIWPNMAKIVILRAFSIKMSRVPFTHFCR